MDDTIKKKIDVLTQPIWNIKEIKVFTNKSDYTARQIKNGTIMKFGSSVYGSKYVDRDNVLKFLGTTTENELSKLKVLLNEEKEL